MVPAREPPAERFHDPRMRGFRARTAVRAAVALIEQRVQALEPEPVGLFEAAGRVLAEEVRAEAPVPPFDRAAMDGYALRGEETFGAEAYTPAEFRLVGESRPGRPHPGAIGPGEAVQIVTGAPLPDGADAVVRVEATRRDGRLIRVVEPTPPGRHVGRIGEDLAAGSVVLSAGRRLRPQDLGVLSACGRSTVRVIRAPRVTVLITGDELLPAGTPARAFQIPDANSVMLDALIARDGGRPRIVGPLPDDRDLLRDELQEAVGASDAILISGGSSTGPEDHAPGLVAELGELPVHGVALRPASPAGVGFVRRASPPPQPSPTRGEGEARREPSPIRGEGGNEDALGMVPVVLLPGNPVSCLCAYDFFAGPMVRLLGGRPSAWPYHCLERPLAQKIASALGRVDYARVRLVDERVEPLAISGASILSSTTRADGFVVVPADLEGYAAGASVRVWLYDS